MRAIQGLLATALFGITTAANAAPVDFGMSIQGRAGYGSNPHLVQDDNPGSLLVGIRLAPQVQTRTETSATSLTGYYDYTHYTRRYGHSDSLGIDARHEQRFSPTLSGNIHAGYVDSFNTLFGPIDTIDEVTIGQRQRVVSGDAGLSYQPNARETWDISGYGSRAFYPNADQQLSDYTNYGGGLGYSRAINDSTSLGARFGFGRYDSRSFADTTSYQPSLTIKQRLSGSWSLDAHVGVILERSTFAGAHFSSTSFGFGANLCRRVPRSTLCFEASRDTSPSGLGGLRTDLRGTASIDYKLTDRSTVRASATYGRSDSTGFSLASDQDYGVARGEYSHRLTERISIGASVDYRLQKIEGFRNAHAVAGAVNITTLIGRMN